MIKVIDNINRFTLFYFCGLVFYFISHMPIYAQQGSYSSMAQRILDQNNSEAEASNLDIFKFSINDVLNSSGNTVENAFGEPTIFGRTDYGSEFTITNDLSTSFSIEIPAFVINDLAETDVGEYFPVIKNGETDAEDGTYVNSYTDNALGTQVTEYFNSAAPNKIETKYDYGTTEIEYLSDNGIDVKNHIYQDGSVYKTYFQDDETNILASTNLGADGSLSRFFSDPDTNYSYSTSNNVDGSVYTSFNDGTNASYSQTMNNNELISSYYYNDGISLNEVSNDDGTSQTTFSDFANDGSGNFKTFVENRNATNSVTNLQYTDQDNTTPIEFTLDSVTDTGVVVTQTFKSNSVDSDIVKTITGGDIKIVYGGIDVFEYRSANKNNLIDQAPEVITDGESVIANGITTVAEANSATNPNSLAIDFKELYDSEAGLAITPEMGYVRLNGGDGNDYINLSNGDIIEFFVRPTNTYLANHNSEELFFIDRAVPEDPVVAETDTSGTDYTTSDSASSETEITIYVAPGEEAVTLPSGEIKVYVTTVYVPAPASNFLPSQVVMPIKADGDYNYDIEPAAAETFPGEVEVVAITEEEAEVLSKKVKAIKKEKASPSKAKDDDIPPVMAAELEPMVALNIFLNNVQKAPSKLLLETRKNIQKEFPNISKELISLIINLADSDQKFDLMQNPKEFLDNEFAKLSDPTELNLLLGGDLPQQDLIKIYNFLLYQFSSDLTELGFDTLRNQEIDFSFNIINADQILKQVQIQRDILAITSLFSSVEGSGDLSSLLIEPVKTNPESSRTLFESSQSQKILGKLRNFSEAIKLINSGPSVLPTSETFLNNDIPVIEVNVGIGDSIAGALEEKIAEDKRLNINFQPRTLSSKLQKYNFELPPQRENSDPPASPPLLVEAENIPEQQLQLVAETTEATNNILDETINRMITELGDGLINTSPIQTILTANNQAQFDTETTILREDIVFDNALLSTQKLQQVEDIRAIFEILGIGS